MPAVSQRMRNAAEIREAFSDAPGLYIHIPFCATICPFCPYNKVRHESGLARRYLLALRQEMDAYIERGFAAFESLYVGGGTPTLCIQGLADVLQGLSIKGERAIEVLPIHATPARIHRMRDLGFNYISLGVQSFNDKLLRYLRRPHKAAQNYRALENVRGEFDCIDVDLIFDVAFEDEQVFLNDLHICFAAGVDQVSTYPLMRFGYTPFGKSAHRPDEEHRLLRRATEMAESFGYERRSVWTFNKVDTPSYTSITREFYLGCGAGAGSFSGSIFFLNHFSVGKYINAVESGRLPIARRTTLRRGTAAAYYVFWQLYTGVLDPHRFAQHFPEETALSLALDMARLAGYLREEGGVYFLTDRGYEVYHDLERWVTYHFIEPLWADMMREHETDPDDYQLPGLADQLLLQLIGLNDTRRGLH